MPQLPVAGRAKGITTGHPIKLLKAASHRWLVGDRLIGQRVVSALARGVHDFGNRNPGWYGAREIPAITGSWRRISFQPIRLAAVALSRQLDFYGDRIFARQVWDPITGPAGSVLKPLREPEDPDLSRGDEYLENQRPGAPPSAPQSSFSIVTPYHRHFGHFSDCAQSVARATRQIGSHQVEWIVVNDDPAMSCGKLWSVIPRRIHDRTRIIANSVNVGNTATLNVGIRASRFEWVLFLDCDDVIAPRALRVLGTYIAAYPRCRYFSSSMIDIDEGGRVLRYRIRESKATQLFTEGMTASHLKAIRRDAFDQLGLLDTRFDGSQDYEFALRIAVREPICFIPEFLYGYRSHSRTQTLSSLDAQFSRAREIRSMYLDLIAGPTSNRSEYRP